MLKSIITTRLTAVGLALGALLSGGGIDAWAANGENIVPGSRYESGRAEALGDAYIGLADTVGDSLFYNPAGLGLVTKPTFEPINAQMQMNDKLVSQFGTNTYKFTSLNNYSSTLNSNQDTNPGGSYSLLPAAGFRGFGVGALYQSRMMAENDGGTIRYRTVDQFVPAAGFGLRLASGVLRIGYSIQYVNQVSGDISVPSTSTPLGWTQGLSEGHGFSHTLGMALTLPYVYRPSINVVARNVGGVHYSGSSMVVSAESASGAPADELMSIDSSIGFLTKLSAGWSLSSQFEYKDATNTSDTTALTRTAAGLEFVAADHVFLRVGFGDLYPAAGLGLKTSRAEVNLSWFSEDIGVAGTPIRDTRYMFQTIFRAF